MSGDMSQNGFPVSDLKGTTDLYRDNRGSCVHWAHTMTSKAICHMELRETLVRKWVVDKLLAVIYVAGKCDLSDIFIQELKDGTYFRCLRDSFCVDKLTFFWTD